MEKKHRGLLGRLQRVNKEQWKKEEFTEIEYQPVSVKDLLTEMKDISELMIDLAYSAVLFNNQEIAEEVKYLEVRMDKLNYDIRMMAMLAARDKDDAEQLAGILQIAEAAESISNGAGDIVNLLDDTKIGPVLPRILKKADEKIYRTQILSKSKACNQSISDINIESETGMRIIAIRRGSCWIYNPESSTILKEEDWVITRGNDDGYNELNKFLHGELEDLE